MTDSYGVYINYNFSENYKMLYINISKIWFGFNRCNLQLDCEDESDEHKCSNIKLGGNQLENGDPTNHTKIKGDFSFFNPQWQDSA